MMVWLVDLTYPKIVDRYLLPGLWNEAGVGRRRATGKVKTVAKVTVASASPSDSERVNRSMWSFVELSVTDQTRSDETDCQPMAGQPTIRHSTAYRVRQKAVATCSNCTPFVFDSNGESVALDLVLIVNQKVRLPPHSILVDHQSPAMVQQLESSFRNKKRRPIKRKSTLLLERCWFWDCVVLAAQC